MGFRDWLRLVIDAKDENSHSRPAVLGFPEPVIPQQYLHNLGGYVLIQILRRWLPIVILPQGNINASSNRLWVDAREDVTSRFKGLRTLSDISHSDVWH